MYLESMSFHRNMTAVLSDIELTPDKKKSAGATGKIFRMRCRNIVKREYVYPFQTIFYLSVTFRFIK